MAINSCTRYRCGICKSYFNTGKSFCEHLQSQEHYKEMDKPSLLKPAGHFHCPLCHINCPGPISYKQHVKGMKHKAFVVRVKSKDSQLSNEDANPLYSCGLCDWEYSSVERLVDDLNSGEHQKNLKDYQVRWEQMGGVERQQLMQSDTFYCDLCKATPNTLENYIQHSSTKAHRQNLKLVSIPTKPTLIATGKSSAVVKVSPSPSNDRSSSVVSGTTSTTGGGDNYKCQLCGFKFPNLDQLRSHLEGQRHQVRMDFFRTNWPQYGLEDRTKHLVERTFYCDLCAIQSDSFSAYMCHFYGKSHHDNMVVTTAVQLGPLDKLSSSQGETVAVPLANLNVVRTATPEDPVDLNNSCRLCSFVGSDMEGLRIHLQDSSHQQRLSQWGTDWVKLNKKERGKIQSVGIFKCGLCGGLNNNTFESYLSHCNGKQHQKKLTGNLIKQDTKTVTNPQQLLETIEPIVTVEVNNLPIDRIFCHLCLSYCQSPCDYEAHRQRNITAESDGSVKPDESVDVRSLKCQCGITPDIFLRPERPARKQRQTTAQPQTALNAASNDPTSLIPTNISPVSTLSNPTSLGTIVRNCQTSAHPKITTGELSSKDPSGLGTQRQQLRAIVELQKISTKPMTAVFDEITRRISELDQHVTMKLEKLYQPGTNQPENKRIMEEIADLLEQSRQLKAKRTFLLGDLEATS